MFFYKLAIKSVMIFTPWGVLKGGPLGGLPKVSKIVHFDP